MWDLSSPIRNKKHSSSEMEGGVLITGLLGKSPTHTSADGLISCFHVLAIVNSVAVKLECIYFLNFGSEYMPSSGIALSYGRFKKCDSDSVRVKCPLLHSSLVIPACPSHHILSLLHCAFYFFLFHNHFSPSPLLLSLCTLSTILHLLLLLFSLKGHIKCCLLPNHKSLHVFFFLSSQCNLLSF